MEERELINLLKREKSTKVFGGSFDTDMPERVWKEVCEQVGLSLSPDSKSYSFRDHLDFFYWRVQESFLRPVSTALVGFALIVSGWIFAMNATYASMPGDVLYSVKLATERVQLQLVFNNEKRAKLQVEFADRRLQEMKELSRSHHEDREALVHTAAEKFKQQMTSVHEVLAEMQTQEPESALALAKVLDEKVDEYTVVLDQSETDFSQENKQDVQGVIAAVEDTDQQAVEVIVSQQETTPKQETAKDLEKIFRKDVMSIETRISASQRRIDVVKIALEEREDLFLYEEDLQNIRDRLRPLSEQINDLMNMFAAGGYRKSFEIIEEIKINLDVVEAKLTDLEILISTQQLQTVIPPVSLENNETEEISETQLNQDITE